MKTFKFSNFMVIAAAFLLFPVYETKAEVLYVDSYGTPTVTSSPLEAGTPYIIETSGTFEYDSYYGRFADAEWAQRNWPNSSEPWVENVEHPEFVDSLDLLVNGVPRDWMGTTDGVNFSLHTYSPSHVYRLEWTGTGEPLAFRIEDAIGSPQYDNIGVLEVNITPEPAVTVDIDIKPGSYPNAINLGSHGLTPVAIFSKVGFDATSVDPNTVNLAGAPVATRGKTGEKFMAHEEDVDGDGMVDLVVQVVTADINPALLQQDGDVIYAVLTANTSAGEAIEGEDEIVIVPTK